MKLADQHKGIQGQGLLLKFHMLDCKIKKKSTISALLCSVLFKCLKQ